jgi:hypothetical protein
MATASQQDSRALPGGVSQSAIRTCLEHLLASQAFAGSRRSQEFLRYVVEETLAGRGSQIKERNIATDVFGKGAGFSSQSESIVRVNASEVRRRLKAAYESGCEADVLVDLPLGSYQPIFCATTSLVTEPAPTVKTAVEQEAAGPRRVRISPSDHPLLALLLVLLLAAGGLTALRVIASRPSASLDLLWKPFVDQRIPVLISLPSPTVLAWSSADAAPPPPTEKVPVSELRSLSNYYVGVGAAFGAARFGEQLALRHQAFDVMFGTDVAFADLGRSPAILLGGFTSAWGLEMTRTLRFRFEQLPGSLDILDGDHPDTRWRTPRWKNSADVSEGYALVSRLLHSETGRPLLIAAGVHPNDTQAAVEFLTEERYFDAFAKQAPPEWSSKNFQVVLHNNVHGHSPGSPVVVAYHVW